MSKSNQAGYLDSPSKNYSPNTNSEGGSKKRNQPLYPVSIYQLLNAKQVTPETDDFTLNQQPLGQIYLIAQISDVKHLATNLNYVVDDSTGRIDVRVWVDQEGNDYAHQKQEGWIPGVYVRIIGNLRSFQGKRHVVALDRLICIDDFNELTHHFLEIIHFHLSQNGRKPIGGSRSGGQSNNTSTSYIKQSGNNNNNDTQLNELQNEIIQLVRTNYGEDEDKGVPVETIVSVYKDMYDEQIVRKTVAYLVDEGHLYTTVDRNHVAPTEEC